MRVVTLEVYGTDTAREIAAELVFASQWFEVEPHPHDLYRFSVKQENSRMLANLIRGARFSKSS